MSNRVANNVRSARYKERNKLFVNFRSGDLVQINLNTQWATGLKLRSLKKNDKGKFTYRDRTTFPRSDYFDTWFNHGQIALYIGRYDGNAVLLINEALYACPVDCIKKVVDN